MQVTLVALGLGLIVASSPASRASESWRVSFSGTASHTIYGSAFAETVAIEGVVYWTVADPCGSAGGSAPGYSGPMTAFNVVAFELSVDDATRTFACVESDPDAIDWYQYEDGSGRCDYGTNRLVYASPGSYHLSALASAPGAVYPSDAATSFTIVTDVLGGCGDMPGELPLAGRIVVHDYPGGNAVTHFYDVLSGTLVFQSGGVPPGPEPVADADGDGVLDVDDACPGTPGDGMDANDDGCPDVLEDVEGLLTDLGMTQGLVKSLMHKLTGPQPREVRYASFANQLEALRGKRLDDASIELLLALAWNALR